MDSKDHAKWNLERLASWFLSFRVCVVAFSGGVDSSLLAFCARRALGANAYAVTTRSQAFAFQELEAARRTAREIGIPLFEVEQDDLSNPNYVANAVNRCYFCRANLAEVIRQIAEKVSADVCVDGTHVEDMRSPRPGIKALREAGFRAPLLELGFVKEDVRQMAKRAGLSVWDRPSEACLSSRIAFGQTIDYESLRRIEAAEVLVRRLTGAKIVRVRTIGKRAVVEVDSESVGSAIQNRLALTNGLRELGYEQVEVDEGGYVSGKMLQLFVKGDD
jgi:uncharacterized protein